MTEISLILLDLNGVVYHYDREVRIACLSAVSCAASDDIRRAIWESGFEDTGDAGLVDADRYLQEFGSRIGHNLSQADWVAAQRAAVTPVAGTLSLLSRIRVACAVLTNNNLLVRRHFVALYPEVAALVGDRAHVSAEFGSRKPDPAVYRRCLGLLGHEPAATLFIDDSAANAEGAIDAGLQGYHYTNPADLGSELETRRLLNPLS